MTTDYNTRIHDLDLLEQAITERSFVSADFKRAAGPLAGDLQAVQAALHRDPEAWRQNRAFQPFMSPA